jgi:hypothetical protein
MPDLLQRIETHLTTAVPVTRRRWRRGTRGGLLAVAGTMGLLGTGIGIAATTGSPVERVVHSADGGPMIFAMKDGGPRQDVRVTDAGGLPWTLATYVAKNGALTSTQAPDGLHGTPDAGGFGALVIAQDLVEEGPASDDGLLETVKHDGHDHYLFTGSVTFGDEVPRIANVDIGIAGVHSRAKLSRLPIVLPLPARISRQNLTSAGEHQAKRFPKTVSVRPYAATFAPDVFKTNAGPATVTVTLTNGKIISYRSVRSACTHNDCSRYAPRVP